MPLDYPAFVKALADPASKVQTVILTAGYPEDVADADLPKALAKKFTILLDVLPSKLTPKADLVLPGATWAEKSGTFENATGRRQTFQQAIDPPGHARAEGQIALDLASALGLSLIPEARGPAPYDPALSSPTPRRPLPHRTAPPRRPLVAPRG